jgi:hypothetical protein
MLEHLLGPITGLLEKVIPDVDERNRLSHEIATMADANALAQIEILKADARGSWFQSSWRPLCGYVAVSGMAVNFLVSPIAAGFDFVIPQADAGTLMPLLLGMLGLSGSRSLERIKGVGK